MKLGTRLLRDAEIAPHLLYITLYVLVLCISSILAVTFGLSGQDALSGSLASLGNVGPAMGDIGTYGSFNAVPNAGKMLFTIDMFLGRIEIYPILAVLAMMFTSGKK